MLVDHTTVPADLAKKNNSLDLDTVRAALEADYEVLEELGRGGMAHVYRARERALDREVAIKVLPSIMAMDADFVDRFQHEARTAGKLEHPNIVPIYRVGIAGVGGRVIYFVMKLLRGQSLATVLKERKKLEVGEVRRILCETAAALGYAAKRNVVHRDIKPDNIMLDDEGRCVVTDFGIAKTSGGPLTAAGTSMGTPRYMSPEHARGIPLDGRSDMYSLGVVAYQCLTGTTPFDADDPFAILYKHINEPLPRPELETDDEWALYAVIEKMLAKKPEDRFQSADDLIAALGGQVVAATLVTAQLPFQVATSPTEIIPTPRFGTQLQQLLKGDWRLWAAGIGVILVGSGVYASRPDKVPPPAAAVTAPPGSTGSRTADSARAVVGSTSGATTGTKSAVAGTTTGAKAPATKVASVPPPVRTPRPPVTSCPRTMKAGTLAVVVAAIVPQKVNAKLPVTYDVCNLRVGAPFNPRIRLRKLSKGRFERWQDRYTPDTLDIAATSRLRRRKIVALDGLEAGRYALDVLVKDEKGVLWTETKEFQIIK
ncbi:MAG: serine/threonine-protein kinase [Gemmatimonadaceae bacterium]